MCYFVPFLIFYSENVKTHINALTTLAESVDRSTESVKKIENAAERVEKTAEVLIEAIRILEGIIRE